MPPPDRAFAIWDPRRAGGRLLCAIVAGIATGLALPSELGPAVRAVAGWDVGATVLLALAWLIIWRSDPAETRRRAAAQDAGRSVVWGLVLTASSFSLFAAVVVLRRARTLSPHGEVLLVALCLLAVLGSWSLTHTAYTLRYAHLYYRDGGEGEHAGGLVFPGDEPPDDLDFAYFAFTVGMCFQVSDVTISSSAIRRAVLGHSVLSFAYNTAVLAFVLNLLFGLFG